MAEIALRTTERKLQKDKYLAWRPVGSTIVCLSDSMIRRKWLEICCDLVAPYKRKDYTTLPGYTELVAAWTPELRKAWLEADRPTEQYKLGQLLMDKTYPQKLWDELIKPIGVDTNLPLAPESNVKVHDTWLWSERERKSYFIVVNTDAADEEVQGWQGSEERDADTGEVLPELAEGEVRDAKISLAIVWKKQIKYATDIGLSGGTLDKIANHELVVNPKFDAPVSKVKFIQPSLADSVIAMGP